MNLTLVQHSDGVPLRLIVKNVDGEVIPLTGSEVSFHYKKTDKTEVKTCSIVDAAKGICKVILNEADLDIGDCHYYYQLHVKFSDTQEYISARDSFYVEAVI